MISHLTQRKMPTAAERQAQKAFKAVDTRAALSEHERAQQTFHANRERLKAERLAREAASKEKPRT
jgi:hypothetical protein